MRTDRIEARLKREVREFMAIKRSETGLARLPNDAEFKVIIEKIVRINPRSTAREVKNQLHALLERYGYGERERA